MTIHAFTEPTGSSPAYINVSGHPSQPNDAVVTVRSAGAAVASSILLHRDQLRALSNDVAQHLHASMRTELDFGEALIALKAGKRVARAGWNGAGQWVALGSGNPLLDASQFWNPHARAHAEQNGGGATVLPYFILKTAQGAVLMGWASSQSDALAEDWQIVE
jgi:hypothetical protein